MTAALRRTVARRASNQHGSTVVEMAVISVFIVTLIAGTYDYGQAWRSGLVVNEATRTAARVGSAQGPLRAADYNALSGAKSALMSSGKLTGVVRVVVFRSTAANGKMPAVCKTGSSSDCQVISGADFRTGWETQSVNAATTSAGCLVVATVKNWCPTTRIDDQATAEYYGVWIQLQHPFEFPLLGSGQNVERTSTMRIEPKVQ